MGADHTAVAISEETAEGAKAAETPRRSELGQITLRSRSRKEPRRAQRPPRHRRGYISVDHTAIVISEGTAEPAEPAETAETPRRSELGQITLRSRSRKEPQSPQR